MFIIQMTGLSGAGKTTLANAIQHIFKEQGKDIRILDGDMYRKTIHRDLGFSIADRKENMRRLAVIADQHCNNNIPVIIAAINPFNDIRNELKLRYNAKTVWIKCDLAILKKRDTKGLYRKALLPDDDPVKIRDLTGINQPFEIPPDPDLVIDTSMSTIECSKDILLNYLLNLFKVYPV